MESRRIAIALLVLRFTIFFVMLIWTIDKFVRAAHAGSVYEHFYFLPGFGGTMIFAIGVTELLLLVGLAFAACVLPASVVPCHWAHLFGNVRFAYTPNKFEEQDDRAYRAWLAREDLNRFLPNERKVEISSIFKWFKDDFEKAGGISKILGRYAPLSVRDFAASGNYEIKYLLYNWGLSDKGPHDRDYSKTQLILDNIFK
jgi:hypothetical protein